MLIVDDMLSRYKEEGTSYSLRIALILRRFNASLVEQEPGALVRMVQICGGCKGIYCIWNGSHRGDVYFVSSNPIFLG